MNIHYRCSEYISYKRAGDDYKECLAALGHTLVDSPEGSDVVILHGEPQLFPAMISGMISDMAPGMAPGMDSGRRRPKIVGYAVWETPQLPAAYAEGVRDLDAVWTCSGFSRAAFAPHARTFVLPHVIKRPKPSPEDIRWARTRLGITGEKGKDPFCFYTIVDSVNPRKNLETLLAAFGTAFSGEKGVRLVVKQYREACDLAAFPGVTDIPEMLSNGQIAALHAVCDAYASAHHAEAWGLPLSEAMAFGNPVIATGYSGNMEFMDGANSFPVPYTVVPVSERICKALPNLFTDTMTWADIDAGELVRTLRRVRALSPGPDFRKTVADSVKRFSPAAIREIMRTLLSLL